MSYTFRQTNQELQNAADAGQAVHETEGVIYSDGLGNISGKAIGGANGVAGLDANGKVPTSQLPTSTDDVEEYASLSAFPVTGEAGKIYIAKDTNLIYRWTGSAYTELGITTADMAGKLSLSGGTMTGAINMGSNKITSLADGTDLADAVNLGQLNTKAPVITDSASGSIASFPDGMSALVKGLKAYINPLQDLHGQSNPYPPNGGKNKLPLILDTIKSLNTTGTWTGNAYARNGVTFTVLVDNANNVIGISTSGTASADAPLILYNSTTTSGSYILNGCAASGSESTYFIGCVSGTTVKETGSDASVTLSSTAEVWIQAKSGANMSSKTFYPMLRLSTEADATFAPYSNECPITGYTGIEITRTGTQLLDPATKNVISSGGVPLTVRFYTDADPFLFKAGYTYSIEYKNDAGARLYFVKANGSAIVATQGGYRKLSYTFTEDTYGWVQFVHTAQEGAILTDDEYFVMHIGDATEDYEAYNGTTFNVSWTSEGTIYYGTLEYLGNGEWKLTVTGGKEQYASVSNWSSYIENGQPYIYKQLSLADTTKGVSSDIFKSIGTVSGATNFVSKLGYNANAWCIASLNNNNKYIYIGSTALKTSEADVKSFIENCCPFDVVYELATPIEYTLSGPDPETLFGENNWFNDNNGNINIEYFADTKLYIDNKIASMQALILNS